MKNTVDYVKLADERAATIAALERRLADLEAAVSVYLRRATENFDLSKNVEVCIAFIFVTHISNTRTLDWSSGSMQDS